MLKKRTVGKTSFFFLSVCFKSMSLLDVVPVHWEGSHAS